MDLAVTIHAILTDDKATTFRRVAFKTKIVPDVLAALATNLLVALLAQLRALPCEQCGMVRAVCTVAQAAVLGHGVVLPEKGTAFFRVTLVTVLVECQLDELVGAR